MHNTGVADRFALMWQKSRADAGKSQEYVAKHLVSVRLLYRTGSKVFLVLIRDKASSGLRL